MPERDDTQARLEELRAEHSALDSELEALQRHTYLSAEEELELQQLKRKKLSIKEEIHRMERELS